LDAAVRKGGAEEFGRRVVAYQSHFRVGRAKAEEMVRDHDPTMRQLRADEEVDRRCRQYSREHRVSYSEAMREVLGDDPKLSAAYRAGPEEIYRGSGTHDYETDALERQPRMNRIAAVISGAKNADHSIDIDLAVRLAAQLDRELIQEAAGDALSIIAEKIAKDDHDSKFRADALAKAFPQSLKEAPGLARAWNRGILDAEGIREMFPQWFHD
jgi:hypothetical protein